MTDKKDNHAEHYKKEEAGSSSKTEAATVKEKPAPPRLPEGAMIVLPVRRMVLFPGTAIPITIGRPRSIAAASTALAHDLPMAVVMQRDMHIADPALPDLHAMGTSANILKYVNGEGDAQTILCQGDRRVRLKEAVPGFPFLAAHIEFIAEPEILTAAIDARALKLKERAAEALNLLPHVSRDIFATIAAIDKPGLLADLIASYMDLDPSEKQSVLETIDLEKRLDKVLDLLAYRVEVLRLSRDIEKQTKESLSEQQRQYILRQQLQAIKAELGEDDEGTAAIEELRQAIDASGMPPETLKSAKKDLQRLERMSEASAEHAGLRTYLETLTELPWRIEQRHDIDLETARRILDEDHYGLDKVKRRILEYLAVRKLAPEGRSPILCFVGPPGVGKTSLGKSIARAMNRKFARLSLGGVHDEAEIRGHRRTYVGAMPGMIIQAIQKAGARDCVLMLDEMDKLGAGFHGDPSAALLEVLDPEQNVAFRDNYLGVTFDLSQVVFITTANVVDAIPGPLRDRMEMIEMPGYTEEEKIAIAKRHLIGRQLQANGLDAERCKITDNALQSLIRNYTREAGCRNLERQIGAVLRHAAVTFVKGRKDPLTIDGDDLTAILGPARHESELAMRTGVSGVATGLAWTAVGGDILFIEAARIPGKGRLILTGQLGNVMKESAQAALSLVKSGTPSASYDPGILENHDIHIHVPAGAIPKDGPSAGIAIYIALLSLLTGRCVRSTVGMTGEISLRGLVLPVGGIKEKVVAAARAGLKDILLPDRNRKDFDDIPESARRHLTFHWMETVDDAVPIALEECPPDPATHQTESV